MDDQNIKLEKLKQVNSNIFYGSSDIVSYMQNQFKHGCLVLYSIQTKRAYIHTSGNITRSLMSILEEGGISNILGITPQNDQTICIPDIPKTSDRPCTDISIVTIHTSSNICVKMVTQELLISDLVTDGYEVIVGSNRWSDISVQPRLVVQGNKTFFEVWVYNNIHKKYLLKTIGSNKRDVDLYVETLYSRSDRVDLGKLVTEIEHHKV